MKDKQPRIIAVDFDGSLCKSARPTTKEILKNIKNGGLFTVAGIEFIKFNDKNGITTAVSKNILDNRKYGTNNNFAESDVKKWLENEILPKIEAEIGDENVIEHKVDLLAHDGSDKWGKIFCKVSLPTFDFYRLNRKTFEKYKLNDYWWLATPEHTTQYNINEQWVTCVSPLGDVYGNLHDEDYGIRPFFAFASSTPVYSAEQQSLPLFTEV